MVVTGLAGNSFNGMPIDRQTNERFWQTRRGRNYKLDQHSLNNMKASLDCDVTVAIGYTTIASRVVQPWVFGTPRQRVWFWYGLTEPEGNQP